MEFDEEQMRKQNEMILEAKQKKEALVTKKGVPFDSAKHELAKYKKQKTLKNIETHDGEE